MASLLHIRRRHPEPVALHAEAQFDQIDLGIGGYLSLQSESQPIVFKDILLKELPQ